MMKKKLVQLFTDHRAENILEEQEMNAIIQYLEKYVGPFGDSKLK
jgi:hypothetical protein